MKIDGRTLLDAIKKVIGVAGHDLVQMALKDNKLRISSGSAGGTTTFEYVLELSAKGEAFEFALPASSFLKILKGNVEITCDRQVVISTASHKAELAYQPFIEPEFEKTPANTVVSPDQIYQIESSLGYVALTGLVEDVHYAMQIDQRGFKAVGFDRVHFGLFVNPGIKSATPLNLFMRINDIHLLLSAMKSDTEGFSMSVHDGFVQARNSVSRLRMALLQISSQEGLPQVEGLAAKFGQPALKVIPQDLYDALDRAKSIYDVTGAVSVEADKGRLHVKTSSALGKFEEVIAAHIRTSLHKMVDPNAVMDILARVYKEEEIYVGEIDRFIFFKIKGEEQVNVTYGALVKQV